LSRTGKVSCSTCHLPELAFTDGLPRSIGVEDRVGMRSAPSLFNVVYHEAFFWDGGSRSMESQSLAPFDNEHEFDLPVAEAIERLKEDDDYRKEFLFAFGSEPNAYGLTRALLIYQAGLLSYDSPFDRFYYEEMNSALTAQEQEGWQLFKSAELSCTECHQPPFFRSEGFFHNGLYEDGEEDPGRYRITLTESDRGAFKVPTLRNISITGPYFHDGRLEELGEVIHHYLTGGNDHPNKDPRIRGFELSESDSLALLAFLNSL